VHLDVSAVGEGMEESDDWGDTDSARDEGVVSRVGVDGHPFDR
jgi:hypothetical protein